MVYETVFLRNTKNLPESDDILKRSSFRVISSLTKVEYVILVDHCKEDLYVINFYCKRDEKSRTRYNRLTNLHEPRNLVETCVDLILKKFLDLDPGASFGFIASNIPGESRNNTKRFRFYERMMSTLVGEVRFSHYKLEDISAYLLIPNAIDDHKGKLDVYYQMLQSYPITEVE